MNKKLAAALSGGAVLVVALTGCTSSSNGGSKGPDPKLVAWAKTVCDPLPSQQAKISGANDALKAVAQDGPPKDVQKTDSQAFQDLADAFKARAATLSSAGAPPGVDGGVAKQQDAVKKLTALSAAYADLKKQVDGLDTKDQTKFAAGLGDLSQRMKAVSGQYDSAITSLQNLEKGDVNQAVAKQAGCTKASASSASPSAGKG
ncbi:small secreted protein [Streptomyces broussonetiae]|uniref:Small secreted protein n=1 Tax=Streptomyces broussonetiae TaxID=2686304 RepID=A0A6I6N3L2_9ACTN|nr:small secreted protein [Streptomyces broussonetiae]QHA06024.1 small secreted protein [Streptomyces broussonetiae]